MNSYKLLQSFLEDYRNNIKICRDALDSDYDQYILSGLKIVKSLSLFCNSNKHYQAKLTEIIQSISNRKISKKFDSSKPNLVFDLDETLIRSRKINHTNNKTNNYDLIIDIDDLKIGIYVRPYMKKILVQLSKYFNLFLFSAGGEEYVSQVLVATDISTLFIDVYSRNFCIKVNKLYLKDLRCIPNYNGNNTLIVENNLFSFANNIDEGILLNNFYGDKSDTELLDLEEMIIKMLGKQNKNLKEKNRDFFMYSEIIEKIIGN